MTRLSKTILSSVLLASPVRGFAQSSEVRIGGLVLSTKQNLLGASNLDQSSGSVVGAEFLARNEAAGIYGRYLTGSVGEQSARSSNGHLRMAEVRIMLGPPVFSLEGGYVLRARAGSLAKPRDGLIRVGARSSIWLGPSGFSLSLNAGAYLRSDSSGGTHNWSLVGWEAVTALFYQAPHNLPFYAMLGYRYERIRSEESIPPVKREELSAILFGIGVRHVRFGKGGAAQPTPE